MQSAFNIVGEDVGVPIIIFHNKDKKIGYFGPVISVVPIGDEALSLWQGLKNLAQYEHFFELKRTRNEAAIAPKLSRGDNTPNVCSV